jgi:hypothetical protein
MEIVLHHLDQQLNRRQVVQELTGKNFLKVVDYHDDVHVQCLMDDH